MSTTTGTRVAVVTGAAMGIGRAIAGQLAADGLIVLVSDLDEGQAARTAAELRDSGVSAEPLKLDVSNPDSIVAAFGPVAERHGRCDVVVNNAGVARTAPCLDVPLDSVLTTRAVNATGTLSCAQHAARLMIPRHWGRIINIASVAGMRPVGIGRTAYGTSKAAVIGLTRQIASELAGHGIPSDAVAPGAVETPLTKVLHSEAFRGAYTKAIPMKRYGAPEEVASIVSFLASERGSPRRRRPRPRRSRLPGSDVSTL